jgi:hypothetical protein
MADSWAGFGARWQHDCMLMKALSRIKQWFSLVCEGFAQPGRPAAASGLGTAAS